MASGFDILNIETNGYSSKLIFKFVIMAPVTVLFALKYKPEGPNLCFEGSV